MNADDPYWDELGVAWRATDANLARLPPRLKERLRRQSAVIATGLIVGFPLAGAGLALGVFTLWRGWTTDTWSFVTRGSTIVLISALVLRAVACWLPFRAHADVQTLSDMLAIASARARQSLFVIRSLIAACVIAGAFGIVGTVIRTHSGAPPHLSPVIDVVVLALIAGCLGMYGRKLSANAAKFEYLRGTLERNRSS